MIDNRRLRYTEETGITKHQAGRIEFGVGVVGERGTYPPLPPSPQASGHPRIKGQLGHNRLLLGERVLNAVLNENSRPPSLGPNF